jgi:hypothetical protein
MRGESDKAKKMYSGSRSTFASSALTRVGDLRASEERTRHALEGWDVAPIRSDRDVSMKVTR